MFNLFVGILTVISLFVCIVSARSAASGSPKSGQGTKCSDKVLTAPSGIIVSPNYGPGRVYPKNIACKWTIKAPVGKRINLYFKKFVVEKRKSCQSDYLLLYDGENDSSRLVGRYCTSMPAPITSSSNYIHLRFFSDLYLAYSGFYAEYNTSFRTTERPISWKSRPKFKSTVLNKTAVVGDLVELQCEVDGTPEPLITWSKDSQNLTEDDNVVIEDSPFKSVLTIKKVSKDDQGRYSCKISNGFGPLKEANGSLVVEDRKIPLITNTTQNQTVSVGQKSILHCEAEGLAPIKMSFREKNKEINSSNCNQSIGCQIQHTKMFVEDTVITCVIWNTAGNTARDIYITVQGPPVIIHAPENQTVQRGDAVNFTCVAVGKNLKISWLKDNEHISDGVITREGRSVLSLSVKKNATLTCNVEGQDGKTSKNARVSIIEEGKEKKELVKRVNLKFTVRPKNLTVIFNDSTSVLCEATGDPPPLLSWKLVDSKVTKTSSFSSKGVSTLELQSLENTVTVVCIARNKYQTINSSATITVNDSVPVDYNINNPPGSQTMNDNLNIILGAGGGCLVLTGFIILFIVLRRKRNKKIEKDKERPTTETTAAREDENLILNPIFSSNAQEAVADNKPGVEMLHYPRDSIEQNESLENGSHIEMFLGRAADLPFSPGEFDVVVRALKNTDPSEGMKDDFDLEASLLANLVHPNVVRLMAVCIKAPPLCLVFEYSSYGYLDQYLQDCDSNEISHAGKTKPPVVRDFTELANVDRLSISKQIASGMKYLADKGYVHQELRARNCLVFKDLQVKVANLGLHWAKPDQNFFVMEPEEKQRFPVRWLPPEVTLYGEYTHSADVWSYAVLVWEIFSNGQLPYAGINDNDVVTYVRGGNILPRPKICPHEVYEVMKSCWEMTPLERPDFKLLQDTMTALHAGVPV